MSDRRYWNRYYQERRRNPVLNPSQFAAFVAGEAFGSVGQIVDVGCGNGRDALFFARQGFKVVGVDASPAAVEICRNEADGIDAQFLCASVAEPGLAEQIKGLLDGNGSLLIYARFFLHAIDDAGETDFFDLARAVCGKGHEVAVEFRTRRDMAQEKVTPDHYRRFIDPLDFMVRAQGAGFVMRYFVEGFGYAKFGNDDAHIARFILTKE